MTLYGILACCLRLLPDKHTVRVIIALVQNRSFTLTTGDTKQSKIRRLKTGVPQESVWDPFLFQFLHIYVYICLSTISCKSTYGDNLALLHSSENWKALEELNHTKTMTAAFHSNNEETKRELNVYNSIRILSFLSFCPTPLVLWTDRSHSVNIAWH